MTVEKPIPAGPRAPADIAALDRPVPARVNAASFGSDVVADALRALDIPYIALNPGASYRGPHDSLVNYLGNEKPAGNKITVDHLTANLREAVGSFPTSLTHVSLSWDGASWAFNHTLDYLRSELALSGWPLFGELRPPTNPTAAGSDSRR